MYAILCVEVISMNDAKMMGSVSEKLMNYVNTTLQRDANYDIALAMLKNYPKLKSLSVGEIAELCFVSKASISRFCHFLGFDSFKEFHEYLQNDFRMSTIYSRQFFDILCSAPETALQVYETQLVDNIHTTLAPGNRERIPDIVRLLHESERIAFFSHHFLWDIGRHIQSHMMIMGRHVELYYNHEMQLECARSLGTKDTAIVCTVGGSYPYRYPTIWNAVESSSANILVLTQNLNSPYWNNASYVLGCGQTNKNDVGKYSALLAADLLLMYYLRRYGKDSF